MSIRVNQIVQYYEHIVGLDRAEVQEKERAIAEGIKVLAAMRASSFRRPNFVVALG